MRKTIVIATILVLSALLAFGWGFLQDCVLRVIYKTDYSEYVERFSKEYGVPQSIVYAVIKTESSFHTDAVSNAGAIGLMQITPDTFDWLCSKTGEDPISSLLYDPETNIRYGTYYLSLLQHEFVAWDTVYAAYNAGRTRVKGWLSTEEYNNNGRLRNIPFSETENYIKKVNKAKSIYERLYFGKSAGAVTE